MTPTDEYGRPIDILLVEDNRGDVRLIQATLKSIETPHTLHVATDGEQATTFLRREAPYEEAPRPDLILLDINLPKKNGKAVLADIKADEDIRRIPVIMLTTSNDQNDVTDCYDLHANCYITKPIEVNRFKNIVGAIDNYWFTTVKLPSH